MRYGSAEKNALTGAVINPGSVPTAAALGGGDPSKGYGTFESWGNDVGIGTDKKGQAAKRAEFAAQQQQQAANSARQQELSDSTDRYRAARNPLTEQMAGYYSNAADEAGRYQTDTQNQANDAKANYTNVLAPNMQNYLDRAKTESGSAMTLNEAGDINNKIQKQTRDFYNDEAQGEGRRGIADTGVLKALGSQATATQLGGSGIPMTGGQLLALEGQNQSQAGQAYANVQKRMQNLRDQGVEQGQKRSDMQYERGQKAVDRYGNAIDQSSDISGKYNALLSGLRGQASDYGSQRTNANLAGADARLGDVREDYGINTNLNALKYGDINSYIAQLQAGNNRDIQMGNANQMGNRQMLGSLAGQGVRAYASGGNNNNGGGASG